MRHSAVLSLLAMVWLAAGCKDTEIYRAEGVIEKLDSVSMVLADAAGGSKSFRTDRARITGAGELILGSPAEVTWQGEYRKGREKEAIDVWVSPVYANLLGQWVESTPDYHQGFEFRPGGTAYAIGMSTVKVSQWELPDADHLWMMGVIVGSGENTVFEELLEIEALTADSLVLQCDNSITRLLRWTPEREAARRKELEAAAEAQKNQKRPDK